MPSKASDYDHVCKALQETGLQEYIPAFKANDITDDVVMEFTADDLKEIIKPLGSRMKVIKKLKELKETEVDDEKSEKQKVSLESLKPKLSSVLEMGIQGAGVIFERFRQE